MLLSRSSPLINLAYRNTSLAVSKRKNSPSCRANVSRCLSKERGTMRTILPPVLAMALTIGGGASAQASPHRNDKVYQAAVTGRAGALDLLKEIVDIDSGTGDLAGATQVEAVLAGRLRALGADVRSEPAEAAGLPDNLVAVFHGTGKGKILIIAHIDTVFGPGTVAGRPFSMDQQRAHGPGVGDEKAGVVNAFTALKILHDVGFKNFATITLLLDDS